MRLFLAGLFWGVSLLFGYAGTTQGQQFKMLRYGIDDGLPSDMVYRVYKDRMGLLWIATDKGISCFNGQQFVNYTTADGLPDNEVFFFAEDRQERLWIGTFNGQLCYVEKGRFYTAKNKAFLRLPFKTTVNSFHLSEDGSITMLFRNRKCVSIKDTVVKIFNASDYFDIVRKLGANEYELLRSDQRTVQDTTGAIKLAGFYVKNMRYTLACSGSENRNTYLIGDKGIYDLDENLLLALREPIRNTYYIPYILVKDSSYFLCTRNGLYTDKGIILKDIPVSGIAADNNGNYWISTLGKGIYCLNEDVGSIKEYPAAYESVIVQAAHFGSHIQFVSQNGKHYALEKKTGKCVCLGQTHRSYSAVSGTFDPVGNYLHFSGTGSLFVDRKGRSRALPACTPEKSAWIDSNNIYLVGIAGINRFSYAGLVAGNRLVLEQRYVGLEKDERIFHFAVDRTGQPWYATFNALYKAAPADSLPQQQWRYPGLRRFAFYEEYLVGYNDRNELVIVNHYDSPHPLIRTEKGDKEVWEKLYPINTRQLIVSSNKNYHLLTLTPSVSDPVYTLRTIENPFIPDHAEYICADSTALYFFRKGSITVVGRSFLLDSRAPPPFVFFSDIKTPGGSYPADSLVTIAYAESRNLKVSFNTLSFYGRVLEYEYSIENHMDHWERIHAAELNIAALPYGSYTIKVRARSRSSAYSAEARLHLVITRPYWATWWFVTAMAVGILLLLLGAALLVLRIIIRRKQKEYQVNMRYQQLEFKSLNALMNPHFIFNSLNNIQGLINGNDKYAANKYLGVFSSMIRQNMENIARERITLKQELDLIDNYLKLEKLRFEHFLDYRLDIAGGIDTEKIHIPALLVQPLVENAVKHGFPHRRSGNDLVCVTVYQEGPLVHIEVKDNGVGWKEQGHQRPAGHNSYGLDNIRARIQHMQQMEQTTVTFSINTIADKEGKPAGTRACISIDSTLCRS